MAVLSDKHYVGEVGTEIIVNCGKNLTGAAFLKMSVRKPSGCVVEWIAEQVFQDKQAMRYLIQEGDFDSAGEYKLQAVVNLGGWIGRGRTASFLVYEKFD